MRECLAEELRSLDPDLLYGRVITDGCAMLVYGTRDPNDLAWFPRSRKIHWRGLGVIGRIETLDYLDGEPIEDD